MILIYWPYSHLSLSGSFFFLTTLTRVLCYSSENHGVVSAQSLFCKDAVISPILDDVIEAFNICDELILQSTCLQNKHANFSLNTTSYSSGNGPSGRSISVLVVQTISTSPWMGCFVTFNRMSSAHICSSGLSGSKGKALTV